MQDLRIQQCFGFVTIVTGDVVLNYTKQKCEIYVYDNVFMQCLLKFYKNKIMQKNVWVNQEK
jgi:hypothetical protein